MNFEFTGKKATFPLINVLIIILDHKTFYFLSKKLNSNINLNKIKTSPQIYIWIFFYMDCLTVYHRIVSTIFEDGIVNADRLYVCYVFTQSYCAQYPDRACDIWTAYNRVVEGLGCVPSSSNQQPGNLTNQSRHFRPISQSESRKKNQSECRIQKETTNRLQSLHSI